ncbi:MAG: PorT family protein [Ignavibacteria bacterium]|nr:PorT family protein [Ignavibacteria bacterium]MBI3765572.1 PorT family protein [Ignavibacteriales bacterium]
MAQNSAHSQVPVRLGIDAGINFANQSLSWGDGYPQSYRFGLIIGGLAEIGISDLLYVQAEPRYIQGGTNIQGTYNVSTPEGQVTMEVDYKLACLEVPLLLKAKLGTADFKPVAFIGPNVGFLLSAIYQSKDHEIQGLDTRHGLDIKDRYKSVNVSLDVGGGVEYRISKTISLTGNARYSLGLNNISTSSEYTTKLNGIQITLGTLFNL